MRKTVAKKLVKVYNKKQYYPMSILKCRGPWSAGVNGAGKSTLIAIMVNGIRNYSGGILYENENIKKLEKDYRKRVEYVLFGDPNYIR